MRWLDGITDTADLNLGKLWAMVRDREAWHAAVHGVSKRRTHLGDWTAATYLMLACVYMGSFQFSQERGFLLLFTWRGKREEEGRTGVKESLWEKITQLFIYSLFPQRDLCKGFDKRGQSFLKINWPPLKGHWLSFTQVSGGCRTGWPSEPCWSVDPLKTHCWHHGLLSQIRLSLSLSLSLSHFSLLPSLPPSLPVPPSLRPISPSLLLPLFSSFR